MKQYSLEMKLEVYNESESVSIQVRQDPDFPETLVGIYTGHDKRSEDFYGKMNLVLDHDQVAVLIEALTKIVNHQITNSTK